MSEKHRNIGIEHGWGRPPRLNPTGLVLTLDLQQSRCRPLLRRKNIDLTVMIGTKNDQVLRPGQGNIGSKAG